MKYYTIPPTEKLSHYVRFFWVLEGELCDGPYVHRTFADSCAELIFHYRGLFREITGQRPINQFTSGIHAQSFEFKRFETRESFGIFGAYLYPYAIRELFRISSPELTNHLHDLSTMFGRRGQELEERIMLAENNEARYQILTSFLESRLDSSEASDHPIIPAIQCAIHANGSLSVDDLAARFNLSTRQFQRKFVEYAGISPKLCTRITRYKSAINRFMDGGTKSLAEVAVESGYYDQSHLIRDFKMFTGHNPTHFFSGSAEGTGWMWDQ